MALVTQQALWIGISSFCKLRTTVLALTRADVKVAESETSGLMGTRAAVKTVASMGTKKINL